MPEEFEHPVTITRRNQIRQGNPLIDFYDEMMGWKMPATKIIMSQQDYEDILKFSEGIE